MGRRRFILTRLLGVAVMAAGVGGAIAQQAARDVLELVEDAAGVVGVAPEAGGERGARLMLEEVEEWVARGWAAGSLVCVLGVGGEEERGAVREAAQRVIGLSASAMGAVDREGAQGELEGEEGERLLIARETVLPLRAARGALWIAACAERERERRAWAGRARSIASGVDALTGWSVGERAALIGLACVLAEDAEGALEAFAAARGVAEATAGESWARRVEVDLGRVQATALARGAEAAQSALERVASRSPFVGDGGVRDWGLALLAADVAHRVGELTSDGRGDLLRVTERSVLRYAGLIEAEDVSEADVRVRRRDVLERVRRVVRRSGVDVSRLPGLAAAAVAAEVSGSDDEARRRMMATLERVLAEMVVERDRFAPDVLFEFGRLGAESGAADELARGAGALLRFAEAAPTDERVGAALGGACAAAGRASGMTDDDGALYLRCLRAAAGHAGPVAHEDTWRMELARVLMSEHRDVRAGWGALLEASEALRGVEAPPARIDAARTLVSMWLDAMEDVRSGEPGAEWRERVSAAALAESGTVREMVEGGSAEASDVLAGAAALASEAGVALGRMREALDAAHGAPMSAGDARTRARIDRARFEAHVALAEVDQAFAALDDAADLDQRLAIDALRHREDRVWASVEAEVRGFPDGGSDESVERASDVLARGVSWREGRGLEVPPVVRARAARALVFAGRGGDAARVIGAGREGVEWVEMLVVLGEAYLAEGEEAAAFGAFRRVASAMEPDRRAERAYWHAWTRMLEILERRNTTGARSSDIRREIGRLRGLESWGEHAECVARIERVGRAVGP